MYDSKKKKVFYFVHSLLVKYLILEDSFDISILQCRLTSVLAITKDLKLKISMIKRNSSLNVSMYGGEYGYCHSIN